MADRNARMADADEKFIAMEDELNRMALEKRLSVEAEHLKRIKTAKTVRFYCAIENSDLKLYVRILNNYTGKLKAETTNIWDLIKRVMVVSDGEIHEWTKESNAPAFLVSNLPKEKEIKLLVKFVNSMDLCKLSEKLAGMLGTETETRPNTIKDIYKYVSANNLLDHATGIVQCNEEMADVFDVNSFDFNEIGNMLEKHYSPVDYMRISLNNEDGIKLFDVDMECDDTTQMPMLFNTEIKMLNKKIESNKLIEKRLGRTIELLEEFVQDPLKMISRYLIMEKDIKGIKTKFFEDLNIQGAMFELLHNKKQEE